jgi:hypothetical protein
VEKNHLAATLPVRLLKTYIGMKFVQTERKKLDKRRRLVQI